MRPEVLVPSRRPRVHQERFAVGVRQFVQHTAVNPPATQSLVARRIRDVQQFQQPSHWL